MRLRILAAAVVLTYARNAAAQATDTDRQIAQQLFDDGRALMDDRRYAEACPKFAESQRLDPGGGTILNLALCHEQEGRIATAWTEFRDAFGQAVKDDRKDRQELAQQHIDALSKRLSRITVEVPPALAARSPAILLDASRLSEAAWNTPIAVDPGEHRVTVTVPGAAPANAVIAVTEPAKTYLLAAPEPLAAQPAPTSEAPRRSPAFWYTLGGSGVLLATSVVTGIIALSNDHYVSDHCSQPRDFCTVTDAGDAASRAHTFAWVSTGTLAAAGVTALVAFLLPRAHL